MGLFMQMRFDFSAEVMFWVRYGELFQMRSLGKMRVNLYRRTPRRCIIDATRRSSRLLLRNTNALQRSWIGEEPGQPENKEKIRSAMAPALSWVQHVCVAETSLSYQVSTRSKIGVAHSAKTVLNDRAP